MDNLSVNSPYLINNNDAHIFEGSGNFILKEKLLKSGTSVGININELKSIKTKTDEKPSSPALK